MSLLEIQQLSTTFRGSSGEADVEAVRGLSLHVERGETVAIVGESGSGKSVTALSVMQLLPYPQAYHPSGSIRLGDHELVGAPPALLQSLRGDRMAMIFQEPMTSLNPLHTVEKQIGETLRLHQGLDRDAARQRSLELLRRVQIPDPEQRLESWPHQLSGGQRQRVMIAMALANEPALLIADEPTTALDVTVQAEILTLLREQQSQLNMGLLLITHDLTLVSHIADRVYVMTQGRVVEQGVTTQILTEPTHPYTRELLASEPPPRWDSEPDPTAKVNSRAEGSETQISATDASSRADPSDDLLQVDDLRVWFPIKQGLLRRTVGHVKAVDGVSLQLAAGSTIGLVGESGSGKTTLAMAVLRLLASEGGIRFCGHDLQHLDKTQLRALRRQFQVVFQDPFSSLSPRLSAFQIVEEGLKVHGIGGHYQQRREHVAAALHEVGLDPASMDRFPHEFSGGQRQRLAIARALILEPRFLVLDEPTSALDRTVQLQIIELLQRLQEQHSLAYLFISHDLRVVRALADELIVLRDGVVVESGRARDLFEAPRQQYTQRLMQAAFTGSVGDFES
ncbi:MAG: ABC transporter ATP-binding protein [Gemmatimonadetes bacterium]|jgi:microcin C transport system ATP-binding protein|nr:ABC transporter ATP-binding protein [Gemmatimonadota bacterium]MBT4611051.1 ABC transporter ATP-binding protein [Gemmatimonadota bacterium]MBT5055271.1 ABC transporter ATP-binding protein [Gemmatimonadota bacterium]MBT5142859.1 ABC transporter ATP-binding protein [Gemmatimonadota bacterium]MBT5589452.1 ABC transporter ATP-binding protein [Gemmatimonadota bacterium]